MIAAKAAVAPHQHANNVSCMLSYNSCFYKLRREKFKTKSLLIVGCAEDVEGVLPSSGQLVVGHASGCGSTLQSRILEIIGR